MSQMLAELYKDTVPSQAKQDLQGNIASILAVMFLSDKPYLYSTVIDHTVEIITQRACQNGCTRESVLKSMGDCANGIAIAAMIGSRTAVSRTTSKDGIC
jgi:hypothetical protein